MNNSNFHLTKLTFLFLLIFNSIAYSQNHSLDFDGTDDYVDLDNIPASLTYSVEFWVNLTTVTDDDRILSANNSNNNVYSIFISGTKLGITVGGGNTAVVATTTDLQSNTWYHVAFIRKSATEVDFYLNGIQEVPTRIVDSQLEFVDEQTLCQPFIASGNFNGNYAECKIDEFRVWDGIRTQSEIQNNMNTELSGTETNLVAYYKFDDNNSANDIEDCTSNGYHGTRFGTGGANNLPQFVTDQPSGLSDVVCMGCSGTTGPTALCQAITINLGIERDYNLQPSEIDNGSSDDCPTLEYLLSLDYFNCDDEGTTMLVDLTVTDTDGNTDSCSANVSIVDFNYSPLSITAIDTLCIGDDAIIEVNGFQSNTLFSNNKISSGESTARQFDVGDFNGDGNIDIVVVNEGIDEVVLFQNLGNNNYNRLILTDTLDRPFTVKVTDFDSDGHLDVIVGSTNDSEITFLKNDGTGLFTGNLLTNLATNIYELNVADIDLDGDLDIIANHVSPRELAYYEIEAGTVIQKHVIYSNYLDGKVFLGDLNGDSYIDISIYNSIFINNSGTGFTRYNLGFYGTIGLHDIDNDSDLDIFAIPPSSSGEPMRLYLNNGAASFSPGPLFSSGYNKHVDIVDYNNDGHNDIFVGRRNNVNNVGPYIWINNGDTTFEPFSTISNATTEQLMVLDIDGDSEYEIIQAYGTDVDNIEIDLSCSIAFELDGIPDTSSMAIIAATSWTQDFGVLPPGNHTFEITGFAYNEDCYKDTTIVEAFHVSNNTEQNWYTDNDGDGYGDSNSNPVLSCLTLAGYSLDNTDCNDNDPFNYPGNTEVCDGYDNNCDDIFDEGFITETISFYDTLALGLGIAPNEHFGAIVKADEDVMASFAPGDNNNTTADNIYIFNRSTCLDLDWSFHKKKQVLGAASFDISKDYLVVSLPYLDTLGSNTGAIYLYGRDEGGLDNWGLVKTIMASDPQTSPSTIPGFGAVVTLYENTIAVTGYGKVYILEKDFGGPNNWGEKLQITGDTPQGMGSSINMHGELLAIGANTENNLEGAVYIYERNYGGNMNWGRMKKISGTSSTQLFGTNAVIHNDIIVVNSTHGAFTGNLHIYERNNGGQDNWGHLQTIADTTICYKKETGNINKIDVSGDYIVCGTGGRNPDVGAGEAIVLKKNQCSANLWGVIRRISTKEFTSDTRYTSCGASNVILDDQIIIGVPGYDHPGGFFHGGIMIMKHDSYVPEALCQSFNVAIPPTGSVNLQATDLSDIDQCWYSNTSVSPSLIDCNYTNEVSVTLTMTDNNSNSTTCVSNVSINDEFGTCCPDNLTVNSEPITDGIYDAHLKILSAGSVNNNSNVQYNAATICLENGFEVQIGSIFEAIINPCTN